MKTIKRNRFFIMKFVARTFLLVNKILRRLWMHLQLPLFKRHGTNLLIGYGGSFAYDHIELGNNVYIGPHATFMAAISTIKIGNKVVFGPHVKIMAGDHRTNVIGQYMYDVKEKQPNNDLDVIIEDDVWVGASAIILKGVTVGRGSIIGAGTVVSRSIPPYSVVIGNPGRVIKKRFTPEQIIEHERLLNPDYTRTN